MNPHFPGRLPQLRRLRGLREGLVMFGLAAVAIALSVIVGLWLAAPLLSR
jgi:hypothetical protein